MISGVVVAGVVEGWRGVRGSRWVGFADEGVVFPDFVGLEGAVWVPVEVVAFVAAVFVGGAGFGVPVFVPFFDEPVVAAVADAVAAFEGT
jgi:hypothetical protein